MTKIPITTKQKLPKVAEYLTVQIDISPLKQREIAEKLGYTQANMISMLKMGLTKLPLEKVPPMANALGVDPAYLLRIVMMEYMPQVYETIVQIFGKEPITQHEKDILTAVRSLSNGQNLAMKTEKSKSKLAEFVKTLS